MVQTGLKTSSTLVTGASGFVGRVLCAELAKRGYPVRAVLRASASLGIAGCKAVRISGIDSGTDWTDALHGVTTVIHLAARVHVMKDASADPLAEFLKVNLHGTVNLAEQAARAGVRRFVYVSSIKVNGEVTSSEAASAQVETPPGPPEIPPSPPEIPPGPPSPPEIPPGPPFAKGGVIRGGVMREQRVRSVFRETDVPDPQDPYGVSKWQAELALQRIALETGLEVVVVRPPLVYGPGVKGNFAQMLKVLAKGIPLPLASVRNLRSLVCVENLVDTLILCATHPAAAGQTYLVSDGEDVSTPGLLRRLGAAMGHPARLFPCPPALLKLAGRLTGKAEQVERLLGSLRVDSGKIRRELGWRPPYTLQQGLQETAEWYRTR